MYHMQNFWPKFASAITNSQTDCFFKSMLAITIKTVKKTMAIIVDVALIMDHFKTYFYLAQQK